jgi:lactococcin 972 family bacteriocin
MPAVSKGPPDDQPIERAAMRLRSVIAALLLSLSIVAPAYATIVNVGGGTWNYGHELEGLWGKHDWSNYVHPTLYHSSTAICASQNVKHYAVAGTWTDVSIHCNWWDSDAWYWNTY